ncbi:MAG: MFS transporter [Gracilibacteraceae bacterium]|jgi:FSR family fosmidomycin resistance protein-like MFS transporter|nr:MFS transporter [Gracilibacteraceae bacterium]
MKISKYSYLTMFGHICADLNQGALPALLPFLVLNYGFSYAMAAGLVFAANLVSAVIQPLFGYLGDRVSCPWFMSLGIFLAGGGLAVVGFLDDYWLIFAAALVSGTGVALFHPEGGRISNLAAGENKGAGMSVFAVGGNIGFAVGPIITTTALLGLGMKGTAVLLVPAVAAAGIILAQNGKLKSFTAKLAGQSAVQRDRDRWGAFSLVVVLLSLRSVVYYSLTTFIPLFCVIALAQTEFYGSAALVVFSAVGAVATLLGGRLADRFGFMKIIIISAVVLCPSLLLFALSKSVFLVIALVSLLAIGINLGYSTMVALGQRFLSSRLGFASGMSYGVTVSVGGLFAPGIGVIGDAYGLPSAMIVVTAVSFLLLLLTCVLPRVERGGA